ncbi:MAG: hypothetical protein JJ966_13415 [Balneolaceae bacterium]|nr:hypothetical protein [Balneolaceae bacterium]
MRTLSYLVFFITLFISTPGYLQAQTSITFSVNLKPQLEDSTFIPGRDQIKIVGDLYPINTPNPYYLVDEAPRDSIYSITVRFSSRFRNQMLNYNFEMTSNYVRLTEVLPRSIQLQGREIELDPFYFNAFAW